jgi:hypothetical protein
MGGIAEIFTTVPFVRPKHDTTKVSHCESVSQNRTQPDRSSKEFYDEECEYSNSQVTLLCYHYLITFSIIFMYILGFTARV